MATRTKASSLPQPVSDATAHPRVAVTVDLVIFTLRERALNLLIVERGIEPFKGRWALPGGFVRLDETIDEAARRELAEETGVSQVYLEQLYTFGDIERDPRERVITVAYYAFVPSQSLELKASTDAAAVRWVAIGERPPLSFDHDRIVEYALERIRNKIMYVPIAFGLLANEFTLTELQNVYEAILGDALDKRNFRKKILASDLLVETGSVRGGERHRPAALYRFSRARFEAPRP